MASQGPRRQGYALGHLLEGTEPTVVACDEAPHAICELGASGKHVQLALAHLSCEVQSGTIGHEDRIVQDRYVDTSRLTG